jgi:hypothetical protein
LESFSRPSVVVGVASPEPFPVAKKYIATISAVTKKNITKIALVAILKL